MNATLVIAGDYCAAGSVGGALRARTANCAWSDLASITRAADFSVVNLECPLTDNPEPITKPGPTLWGPVEAAASSRCRYVKHSTVRRGRHRKHGMANEHSLHACQTLSIVFQEPTGYV